MIKHAFLLFTLHFQIPGYGLLLILPVAFLGAYWLYFRKNIPFTPRQKYLLFTLRAIWLSLLLLLLFNPVIEHNIPSTEKPHVVFLIDDSQSMVAHDSATTAQKIQQAIENLKEALQDKFQVKTYTFGEEVRNTRTLTFAQSSTNLSAALQYIHSLYYKKPPAAILLISDGIYNRGIHPSLISLLPHTVHVLGTGDTSSFKNVRIEEVKHNSTVFLGNSFQAEITLSAEQLAGQDILLQILRENGKIEASQNLHIPHNRYAKNITVNLTPETKGIHSYTVKVMPLKEEKITQDNEWQFYVEAIDNRHKILILAAFPHPDIAFMKDALENDIHFEVKVHYPFHPPLADINTFSAIIYYQIPTAEYSFRSTFVKPFFDSKIPAFFIAGTKTQLNEIATALPDAGIIPKSTKHNQVQATLNTRFSLFKLNDNYQELLSQYPPLAHPFHEARFSQPDAILFFQYINGIQTTYPLLWFDVTQTPKKAFLMGENFWRWKLYNYRSHRNHQHAYEWFLQTVRYIAFKPDNNPLKVRCKPVYDSHENLLIEAEFYNQNYQLINDPEITFILRDSEGKTYRYVFHKNTTAYYLNLGLLPSGKYSWTASTTYQGKQYQRDGILFVRPFNPETYQTRADFTTLAHIANKNSGTFLPLEKHEQMAQILNNENKYFATTYHTTQTEPLLSSPLYLIMIIIVAATEWTLRKYWGSI